MSDYTISEGWAIDEMTDEGFIVSYAGLNKAGDYVVELPSIGDDPPEVFIHDQPHTLVSSYNGVATYRLDIEMDYL